jgi:hypothetical protein
MRTFVMCCLLVVVAVGATACEKSNDAVIQEQFRESQNLCAEGCDGPVGGCAIKGNISVDGERFYHVPGTLNYSGIVIEPARGERWFCTEEQAQRNGFVRKDF